MAKKIGSLRLQGRKYLSSLFFRWPSTFNLFYLLRKYSNLPHFPLHLIQLKPRETIFNAQILTLSRFPSS